MSRRGFPKASASIIFAGTLLLSACATAVPSGDMPPSDHGDVLAGTSWVLDALGEQRVTDDTTATLQFAEDGTLSGSGGCNRYNGDFTADGDTLEISELASTLMLCEGTVGQLESSFITALDETRHFTVAGDTLTLSDDGGAVLLLFIAQSEDLAGAWVVTGYNDGREAVVSVLEDAAAEVSFDEDGNISGTGGCNRLMGTFTADEGNLAVETVAMTKMACPEPVMEQESALIAALESATGYSVEGNELRLTTADGATAMALSRG